MALLNSQPMGFYSPHALLQTAQRDGVKVLPVCAQRSVWDSTLERINAPGEPHRFGLRLGFRLVAGLRRAGANMLVHARELEGGFRDLEHLLKTSGLYRNDLTALAAADAFHTFGLERKAALWLAEAAPFLQTLEDEEDPLEFVAESAMEKIQQDFAATGTSLGPHPTVVIRSESWCYEVPLARLTRAVDLQKVEDGRIVQVFGMVLVRQAPPSANGMVFFTLEDETGFINLAFTPNVYERFFALVERQAFLCVRARVQRRNESHSLMVAQIYEPCLVRADVIPLNGKAARPESSPPPAAAADAVQRSLAPSRNYM